ncbi:MAG: tyrosine-type recombinase/integrase [Chitinophaga rupis]
MKIAYPLTSDEHQLLWQGFAEWLAVLGYAGTSVVSLPRHVREFLHYQEARGKYGLQPLTAGDAGAFIQGQQTRIGIRTGQGFSAGHINKYIQALHLFSRYIRESGKSSVGFTIERLPATKHMPAWLTRAEIRRLYGATKDDVLGMRDRAMLSVFYGCGLRLQEGACLECSDVLHDRKLLYIRRGKGYKERYVPIAEKSYQDIRAYIEQARPQLLQRPCATLFIDANKGRPIHKQSLYLRIKGLVRQAGIQKPVGTHSLRHSIATHLLQSGMTLERIKDFLGHTVLDSTQLYTHLINEHSKQQPHEL